MLTLKFLVLCLVVFMALCEEIRKLEPKSTKIIDTRFKRETEQDCHSRDEKPIVPPAHKSKKPLIPVTKTWKLVAAYPRNAKPKKGIVPIGPVKSRVSSNNNFNQTQSNDIKKDNKRVTDTFKPVESAEVIYEKKIDNRDLNTDHEVMEKRNDNCTNKSNRITTIEEDMNEEKDSNPDLKEEEEIKLSNDIELKDTSSDKVIETEKYENADSDLEEKIKENQSTAELKTFNIRPIQNDSEVGILSRFKLVPKEPIGRPEQFSAITNKLDTEDEEQPHTLSPPKINMSIELSKNNGNNTLNKDSKKEFVKTTPLSIHSKIDKMPIKIVSGHKLSQDFFPVKPPKTQELKILADTIPIKKDSILSKTETNKTASGLTKLPLSEPEEIVILKDSYEELYKEAPKYVTPSIIAADLRTSDWQNYNSVSQHYNRPYSYKVNKSGNQYIVTAFDETNGSEPNKVNDEPFDLNTNNVDNKAQKSFGSNTIPSQQYYNNQFQIQNNPKLIWRSWNNNQIFIRPKSGNTGNVDLYRGIGKFIANSQSPSYSASSFVNQNTSPRPNPFQYKSYGY